MAFETMTQKAFEALPEKKAVPSSATAYWEPIIAALSEDRIVKIPASSEKEKKGRKIALGRRTKKAGFKVEIRYGEDFLAVRRVTD